jgi:AraC-like DNA-binding protein
MPGSATLVFSEPKDFEAALRPEGYLGLWVTGGGRFRARLTRVALHYLRLSTAEEQLSRIAFVAVPADMVMMSFPIGTGTGPVYGGIAMRAGEIVMLGPGRHVYARTHGPCRWGAVWLPVKELIRYGGALTGTPFAVPPIAQRWRPPPSAIKGLQRLHAAATRMAEIHPKPLVDPETAHGLEQQLINAMVECLSAGSVGEGTVAARRHQEIMVAFERLLGTHPDRNVRITKICTALGVSDRLLRDVCAEHLGMSGNRYLRLRRMSLARRALRDANGHAASVSEIARRYGFADPGRFAVEYRVLFGELPSATLWRGSGREIVDFGPSRTRVRKRTSDDPLTQINEVGEASG